MSAYTQYDFGIYSPKDRDRFGKERATFLGGCAGPANPVA